MAPKTQLEDFTLEEILRRFGLSPNAKLLSAWHAFTFEVQESRTHYVLRITPSNHRTMTEIEGELDWMAQVHADGVVVPRTIRSLGERSIECISAGEARFSAVLFEKLDGKAVSDADWTPGLFRKWGALFGLLHRIAAKAQTRIFRAAWNDSDFLNLDSYIPDSLPEVKASARELVAAISELPRDRNSFGIIHADVYQDNFFLTHDGLQLFDFDNCEYGFFVSDIAISLYAALWRLPPHADKQSFAEDFLSAFLEGYNREYNLPPGQLSRLPLFLRLREVYIYVVARKMLDLGNLTPIQASLLADRSRRIAARQAIVDLNAFNG